MATDKAKVFATLESGSNEDRLKAARELLKVAQPSDLSKVNTLKALESNHFVLEALDRVLEALANAGTPKPEPTSWISRPVAEDLDEVRQEAVEQVTQMILHETRPIVAKIDVFAAREIAEYEKSETQRAVNRLKALLSTIDDFNRSVASPQFEEFDLTDLVARIAREHQGLFAKIQLARDDPVVVLGAPSLVDIAFQNILRNAIEASRSAEDKVVVSWGATDKEYWLSVLDDGQGFAGSMKDLLRPGATTKSKASHFGWGLPISERAVHSLGGTISLNPRKGKGTSAEIRWPRLKRG